MTELKTIGEVIAPIKEEAQHMQALALANHVQRTRARIKREIYAGEISLPDLLADPPPEIENMAIGPLVRAQRRWGRHKTSTHLRALAINENRTVTRLSERQRWELIHLLRERSANQESRAERAA